MKVMVPSVNEQGHRKVLRPTTKDESMLERYKAAKNDHDVQILKNKQPKWNDQVTCSCCACLTSLVGGSALCL